MSQKKLVCSFCSSRTKWIDYKNIRVIRPFLDRFARIKSKYYTGVCLGHQKDLAKAVKKARIMALLPFQK